MFSSCLQKSAVQAGGLWDACLLPLFLSATPQCNHSGCSAASADLSLRSSAVESHQGMKMEYPRSLFCSCTSRFAKLTSFACPDPRRSGRTSLLSGALPTAVAVGRRGFPGVLFRLPRWTLVSSWRCHSFQRGGGHCCRHKTARKGEMHRRLGKVWRGKVAELGSTSSGEYDVRYIGVFQS